MRDGRLEAYLLTLAIEVPFLLALAWALRWVPGRRVRLAAGGVVASGITHPILWGIWDHVLVDLRYLDKVALLETGVVLVEAAVLAWVGGLGWRRGLLASLLANAVSTAVGLLMQ